MKRFLSILLALAVLACLFVVFSHADFGDFGGDNDFGGGGGGGDWGGGNDDYSSSSGGGGAFLSGYFAGLFSGDPGSIIVTVIVVAFIVWVIVKSKKAKKFVNVGDRRTPDSALRPIADYKTIDPNFNEADLREKLSNLYVQMQNCWTAKDISSLRPYFTDALYTQFDRQLAQKKAQGVTNYIERISVQYVNLRGFTQDGACDHMILELQARIVDYTVNDATGQVISGDKDKEKFMTYEFDLSRTTGHKSVEKDEFGRTTCPSCGAPLDINASARCEYCGSVLNASDHDWAICKITAISQQTV